MTAQYEELTERLESFDSGSSKQEQEEVLEKLKETHATSAGLKAFCTVSFRLELKATRMTTDKRLNIFSGEP